MRIEWRNEERTLAILTRGVLWWRRATVVTRSGGRWRYASTDHYVGDVLDSHLDEQRSKEFKRDRRREEREKAEAAWVRVRGQVRIPKARVRS